jgi:hypothetical protein
MRHLTLVATTRSDVPLDYGPAPFDLALQPTRPGVAHEPLTVRLDACLARQLSAQAAAGGLPCGAWAALAIDSARVLALTSHILDIRSDTLAQHLDEVARAPSCNRIPRGPGGRLLAYAHALRAAQALLEPREPQMRLTLPVPYASLIAWQQAAAALGQSLQDWAVCHLAYPPRGRVVWEAAAAESGSTQGEWMLAQAASRWSCSSAVAQPSE